MMGPVFPAITSLLLVIQSGATGSITGNVRDDATGEPLGGAVVSLTDLNRSAVTDAAGYYRLERVPTGARHLVVRRIGYAPRVLDVLTPLGGSIEITIALRAQAVELGAVDVGSSSAWDGSDRDEEAAPPVRSLSIASLREHPLLAEPDVLQALNGGAVSLQPESPSGIHVRGGGSDQITYLLDGVPVFSPYHAGGTLSSWNPDALAGVTLETAHETWDALSGVVAATTRAPGTRPRMQSGLSTTQMRLTLDGPLGRGGAGYLVSVRSGFPGFPTPQRDSTYLRGETGDQLAKIEAPLGTGRVRLLGYETTSEFDASAAATSRNAFSWRSRSIGGDWTRASGIGTQQIRFWIAGADAAASWHRSDSVNDRLATRRRDAGFSFTLGRGGSRGRSVAAVRLQNTRTAYRLGPDVENAGATMYVADAPLGAVFAQRSQGLASRLEVVAGLTATWSAGGFRLSPRGSLLWSIAEGLRLSAGYTRLHQFAQSLRNPESVVGTVFPVDLYVAADRSGGGGIPIARSDQAILALEYKPTAAWRISGQGYTRRLHNLVLVAPNSAEPFATGSFTIGSGEARGFALDLVAGGPRAGLMASYGQQRVRLASGSRQYVPEYGPTHTIDAGVTVHPFPTFSLRIGGTGRFGRRATALATPFEWESCNLADRGCEFVGSPRSDPDALGDTPLPGYVRLDIGVRKEWHVRVAGREGSLSVFGTLTNVFARQNVWTLAPDPSGGQTAITMRPRTPLVIGVDLTF